MYATDILLKRFAKSKVGYCLRHPAVFCAAGSINLMYNLKLTIMEKIITVLNLSITTLGQLARVINESEDFPVATVNEAIEYNGWHDDQHTTWGICHTDTEKLELNENGEAEVNPLY